MKGILRLAYKLLVNDKSKFTALLLGITFAVFLIMFITSMFSGVLNHASSTIINIGATCGSWTRPSKPCPTRSACRITFWTRFEACKA